MNSTNTPEPTNREPVEGGYGSPTPEQEVPDDAATSAGSPDPTLNGDDSDEVVLQTGAGLGTDPNFFQDEDAGSDGEPGAGRYGGTDDQLQEELDRSNDDAASTDADSERSDDTLPPEMPSTEAPLTEGTAGPTSQQRESFSSESDADAAGEPLTPGGEESGSDSLPDGSGSDADRSKESGHGQENGETSFSAG